MKSSSLLFVLALSLAGCASEVAPAASEQLDAPELSRPREPRKTADPAVPIREHRRTIQPPEQPELRSEARTIGPAEPDPTPGRVNALDRAPGEPRRVR